VLRSSDVRRRRIALAAALRRFSLTDHFGIDDLLISGESVSISELSDILTENASQISASVPIEFIARSIYADLENTSKPDHRDNKLRVDFQDIHLLNKLKPGRRDAPKYHDFMMRVLPVIFCGSLANLRRSSRKQVRRNL
jgi:hypothetical protein